RQPSSGRVAGPGGPGGGRSFSFANRVGSQCGRAALLFLPGQRSAGGGKPGGSGSGSETGCAQGLGGHKIRTAQIPDTGQCGGDVSPRADRKTRGRSAAGQS